MTDFFTWLGLWLSRLIAKLPRPWLIQVSSALGISIYFFYRKRRLIALRNLKICFPQKKTEEIQEIAKQHFCIYVLAYFDRFTFWFSSAEEIKRLVKITGWENFEAAGSSPVILLAPHFLGIEGGGMRFQIERQGVNIYSLQRNKVLDKWTFEGRSRFNNAILLSRGKGIVPVIKYLRKGLSLHFSPDLDLGAKDSVFVKFFGIETSTVTSLVRLARITDAMIVPYVTRITPNGYEAHFYPGWKHLNDNQSETIEQAVQKMNHFIEQRVLEMPAQYLWTHRRFKTRPSNAPPIY